VPLVLAGSVVASAPGVSTVIAPSRERLAGLYAEAVALVHPALYEGFGMTLLEAMSLGVPVLAARAPGVVEVAGPDAARFVEPGDVVALAAALAEMAVLGGEARAALGARGLARAAEFSWARSAQQHLAAYSLAAAAG
jgi:glycosyltransferase involved in cell wall biosynthesis